MQRDGRNRQHVGPADGAVVGLQHRTQEHGISPARRLEYHRLRLDRHAGGGSGEEGGGHGLTQLAIWAGVDELNAQVRNGRALRGVVEERDGGLAGLEPPVARADAVLACAQRSGVVVRPAGADV